MGKRKKINQNCTETKKVVEGNPIDLLNEEEINQIWAGINKRIRYSRKIKLAYRICPPIVATIALMFVSVWYFAYQNNGNERIPKDIVSFANNQQPIGSHSPEVQLILSDNEIITITEPEPQIRYDSTFIQISAQKVPKKEAVTFNQLITPIGKRSMIAFHEGTKIWVNSGTKLVYPVKFDDKQREIYVEGEAYIDVAIDPKKRPFIVRTDQITVHVLGTKFNVEAYASDSRQRVVTESGLVKITSNKNENGVLLSPNKMYEYGNGQESVNEVNVHRYISWIDGLYIYEDERLDVIFTRLSRYYGKKIIVDQSSAMLKCSGKLDLKENLEDVLSIIAYTAPIEYSCVEEKYIITFKP